jgi:hypothetical protein
MSNLIEIKPAGREMSKMVVAFCGTSGGGKTRTALEFAYGLSDFTPGKIGLLDCENRRGALYCDVFKGRSDLKGDHRFLMAELVPPFSPDRYIAAMQQFAESGIEVLIIDSTSHEYEGEGGVEEIANDALLKGKKMANWIGAKRAHKRFVNTLLFLPVHVICCVRAREKTDFKDPNKPVSLGIQPIAEKNFLFEATFSFLLKEQGKKREIIKLSSEFEEIVGADGFVTQGHGKALRDWLGGFDPLEQSKSSLRLAASRGTDSLKTAWAALPKATQKELVGFKDTLKDLSAHADVEMTQGGEDERPEITW